MLEIPSPNISQAIVDRIETGVFAVDLNRKISYWNYGAETITGFLGQDVLGRPCSDSILVEYDDHNPLPCMHQCPLENTRGDGARRGRLPTSATGRATSSRYDCGRWR
jgi:PAS domain S-box-containing protein